MKKLKILIGILLLLLIINVNAETFEYSIGSLPYAYNASLNEYDTHFEITPGNNLAWLYISLPYSGIYEIDLIGGGTVDIWQSNINGDLVYITRETIPVMLNITCNKPFIGLRLNGYGTNLYKNSIIKLLEVDYTYVNYSENTKFTYPIMCPYDYCSVHQGIYTSYKDVPTNSFYNLTSYGYSNILDSFSLIDYCNIVDSDNQSVLIYNTVYDVDNLGVAMVVSSHIILNNFDIDDEYIITPNNSNPVEIRYNSNSSWFGVIVDDFDILRGNEDNSVNWYWDGYMLYPYQEIQKNLDLKAMGDFGWDVTNGNHQLKAIVEFTCGINKEIIWDVEIYGDYVNYSQVNLDVVVYAMGCGHAELLDGADVLFKHNVTNNLYVKFTNINGTANFRDLIDIGEWNFKIGKTGYITEKGNMLLYLGYNFYTAYLFPKGTNSTLKVYVFDENLVSISDSNLYLGDGFNNFVIYTNGVMDKCDFECEKIDNLNIIRKIPYGCTGEYVLKVTKEGYIDEEYNIWMDGNRTYSIYLQNKSTVLTQSITGYVRSYYPDSPLINVRVEIESPAYNYNYTTFTNSTGHYVINDIPRSNINLKLFGSSIGYQDKTVYSGYFLFENKTITTKLIPKEGDITILKGVVTECNKGLPLDNIKIEVYNDSTYSFIIVPNIHTNSKGEWETRLFSNTLYFLRFSHIDGYFITKEISIEVGNSYQQEKNICLLSAFTLFSVNFRIAENNSEMPVYVDGYMKLNLVESFSEHENVSTFSKHYRIEKEGITIFLFPGIYKADIGKMQGQVIMTKEFLVDKDGLVIFYLSEKGYKGDLKGLGIPLDEKSFFEFWNNWGWAIFFIISVLFTLVIIKTEWKELRK